MPAFPKYHIPAEELRAVAAARTGYSDLAKRYGCSVSTVRDQAKALNRNPTRIRDDITPGTGGDKAFAERIGHRVFEDAHLKAPTFALRISRSSAQPYSLTGCAASLACV